MSVRLADPDSYLAFGQRIATDPEQARPFLAEAEAQARFESAHSELPARPDTDRVQDWLLRVRDTF